MTIEELISGLKDGSIKPTKDCYIDDNGGVHITGIASTTIPQPHTDDDGKCPTKLRIERRWNMPNNMIQCKNCSSFKVRAALPKGVEKTPLGLVGGFIGASGCLGMILGLLFFPLLPVAFLLFAIGTLILWAAAKKKGLKAFKCRACKAYWEE